ncbi:MAG: hypothetical protein Q9213_002911 [Squamulea squamosa]
MDQIPPGTDLTKTPAGKPPVGVESNLVDPPNLATETIVVTTIMITLASIFVLIRLTSIYSSGRRTAWDDYTCFIGYVLITFIFAQNIIQAPAVAFAKSSILLLYLRIFNVKPRMRYAIYAGLIFTNVLYWIHVPLVAGFCAPRGNSMILDFKSCGKLTVWGPVQGFFAMLLDVYIFALPFPVLAQLKLPPGKRLGVYVLFGTAVCGIIASTLAEVYRFKLWFNDADLNWQDAQLFICIIVEGYVAIIVGSMPALAAFFRSPAVSNSGFFRYVRSHITTRIFHSSHTNPAAKASKTSGSSGTKRSYTRTNSETESNSHLRDHQYMEMNDVPTLNAKAYSHANGPNRDIEEGVIKKSVAIKQSQQSL